MSAVRFTVPGKAIGKGRHRSRIAKARDGRQFVAHYTPAETANYETLVRLEAGRAMQAAGLMALVGPVRLEVFVFLTPPQSWSAKKQRAALAGDLRPDKKPDASNILKSIEDGMNGVVFGDDSQIVDLAMCKRYGPRNEVLVVVAAALTRYDTAPLCTRVATGELFAERVAA